MPKVEKSDYMLEIRSSVDDKLLHKKEYTKAYSETQAERNFKIRAISEGWDYFWGRDYVRIIVSWVPPPSKTKRSPSKDPTNWTSCPKCRKDLDDDYCQNCGWRRYSQWYSRLKRESSILKGQNDLSEE